MFGQCLDWLEPSSFCQGDNPFTGNPDDLDPEDSVVMDVSELELTSEAADGQTQVDNVKEEPESEGETDQPAVEGEAAEEVKMEAEAEPVTEVEEEQGNQEEEGFEVGEEDEEEDGYVVHDEIDEEGLQCDLDEDAEEGLEVAEAEEEDKNDNWLLHPAWLVDLKISPDRQWFAPVPSPGTWMTNKYFCSLNFVTVLNLW